jgi:putative transposase
LAGVNVARVCRRLGMTRQNYYARRKRRRRREVDADLVEQLVRCERALQPRLGGRKLRVMIGPALADAGVQLGRDRFFEVLREKSLLLEPKRSESPCTTNSYHNLPVFKNLIKGREVTGPNEIWVGDLTYLRTEEGFLYLSLLTDKMSRHIVGYNCGETMAVSGSLTALEMALKQLPKGAEAVHHSDRGSQYCCHAYVERAQEAGLRVSMTETNHCAENALAERMNGILKGEYGLDHRFKTKAQAKAATEQAIRLYGTRRPHTALGNRFPIEVHGMFLPPAPPSCGVPGEWDPGARHELRTEVQRPAHVGATPLADHPVEPLRGR